MQLPAGSCPRDHGDCRPGLRAQELWRRTPSSESLPPSTTPARSLSSSTSATSSTNRPSPAGNGWTVSTSPGRTNRCNPTTGGEGALRRKRTGPHLRRPHHRTAGRRRVAGGGDQPPRRAEEGGPASSDRVPLQSSAVAGNGPPPGCRGEDDTPSTTSDCINRL